jgi:hypothetical protein
MKKLLLCAFAMALTCAVQAGDNKAASTEQAKDGCCAEKTSCCASKATVAKAAKKADTSVKGATLLVRR